jgi:hypothetical protein
MFSATSTKYLRAHSQSFSPFYYSFFVVPTYFGSKNPV